MKKILLTGAGGMVGSNVLSHLLKNTDHEIVCVCSWKHKGLPSRIMEDENYQQNRDRVKIITHDLISPFTEDNKKIIGHPDIILNIASESHVDRSIIDPVPFIKNNTDLILTMLEFAREVKPEMFLQFSTDEVYGSAPLDVDFPEWSSIIPSNPYSASKSVQEDIAISYWRTYGVPLIITNTMNIFSANQDKEKFIPLCIDKIDKEEEIQIHSYADGKTAGSRFYIHARNVADAMIHIIDNIKPKMYPEVDRPERLNIVGEIEIDNLSLAQMIAKFVGKPLKYKMVYQSCSRPGHDLRYSLSGDRLAKLGWKPKVAFEESLKSVVDFVLHR